ncbi:ZIP family metal transporter [Planctomicrobium piriforme]|uniref:Zinc and cadmium transporter n=1 Tax=Planctomicrobium piriforme TaxID=1576369 RepID=A0A1I3IBG2_9PLAN|nr:ZIP family metal transporter [Planctomicrobium piriforme]SFI45282.1 zinc and cadmium transporter [Planctomicrobium piriforme]
MSSTLLVLAVYCVLIVAASLLGGRLPSLVRLTHKRMQLLISFVGGLMLGIAIFHMLPHAIAALGPNDIDRVAVCLMLGMVVMFFLLRAFHFHQHDPQQGPVEEHSHDHDHGHDHDHDDGVPHQHAVAKMSGELDWLGVFLGLSLHTLIDGLALGASLEGDALHQHSGWVLGLGTFLAIVLHKPLDALSITSLMQAAHWSPRWQIAVNAGFAMMCPLGALLFLGGANWLVEQQSILIGTMLAFSAGVFLCISLSDLLPEMEFHSHHRIPLSIALLLGIALAWGIRWLEPASAHQMKRAAPVSSVEWGGVE